jgi:hypothetical protein
MKKILIGIIMLSLLALPVISLAQLDSGPLSGCTVSADTVTNLTMCPTQGACTFADDTWCAICCLFGAIFTLTDWIFAAIMLIVGLLVILGGFTIATAGGDPSKLNSGRNYILYAMIGFAIALFASAIPNLVRALVGA